MTNDNLGVKLCVADLEYHVLFVVHSRFLEIVHEGCPRPYLANLTFLPFFDVRLKDVQNHVTNFCTFYQYTFVTPSPYSA